MQSKARQFLLKVAELPEEVGFYYQSKTISDAINDLCENHKLEVDYLGDLIDETTINDFSFENLKNKLKQDLNLSDDEARQVFIDYLGKIFLPIDNYVKVGIQEEVKRQGGDVNDYKEYVDEFKDEIEGEKIKLVGELVDKYEEVVDLDEEKRSAINIFENNLSYILKNGSDEAIFNLNNGLMILLKNKKDFKEEISRSLFMNGELLTHEPFELDNKAQSPTIGNWIQDFIKVYGSGMFNNLALTKYITESKNAKCLPQEEKRIVQKLLRLYRNIKFFPESMPSDDGEGWEIIPINKELDVEISKKIIGPPKTEEEKEIEKLKQEETQFSEGGLEQLAIEEEIDNKKKLESLKIEANKYTEGSLERMAVEEEIRKIN
ncbi:hypothetical protein KAU09_05485 [Candidatus Parcubacteria bacterium]|nr:hypothetical protein [Candidatus Parcubacteria bacterium]